MHKDYTHLIRHDGNKQLFLSVELSALAASSPTPLHLHVEGLRGTGKTSVLRAARAILPPIERIKGCQFNCAPEEPHCPAHRHLDGDGVMAIGTETIPMPFLEISHSAKLSTAVGSIDLGKLTDKAGPAAALLPGTLAQAHRGIVVIDEINRLADTAPEITDVLLDVMGTKPGRLQIEETGFPRVELPLRLTIWAASNPDEDPGPLEGIRRQLADRFDLCALVSRPMELDSLKKILTLSNRSYNPVNTVRSQDLHEVLPRMELDSTMPDEIIDSVAKLYTDYNMESLRAAEAILYAARMHCARRRADTISREDLSAVLPITLRHRVPQEMLAEILAMISRKSPEPGQAQEEMKEDQEPEAIEDDRPAHLLARLIDAFRESPQGKGPYEPRATEASLAMRQEGMKAVPPSTPTKHQEVGVISPPDPAQELATIPGLEQVKGEADLK